MKIVPLGHTLSVFFVISLVLCIVWGLITPMTMNIGEQEVNLHMHQAWEALLPGFHWSIVGILIGMVWAYLIGWYTAFIVAPLYNFFNKNSN